MAVPSTTKIGLDVNDVVSAASKYATSLGVQVQALDGLIIKNIKFNEQGKVIQANIEAQISAHKRLAVAIRESSKASGPAVNADLAVAGGRVTNIDPRAAEAKARAAEERAARAQARAEAAFQKAQDKVNNQKGSVIAGEQIRNAFPAPTSATFAQLARYEGQIARIQALLARGSVSSQRFNEIFSAVKSGGTGRLGNLSGDESKLLGVLNQIQGAFTATEATAKKFSLSLKDAFRIAEALILKDVIGAIFQQLQQGVVAAAKFQVKISEIRTLSQDNQSSFDAWGKSIRTVSDALGVDQIDVAEAAYNALSNQVTNSRQETEAFIQTAGELGRVGVAKTSEAVELLSSALNAYNIDIARSEELSAKFFKAVDLGRFKIQDLAGNFGRISAPAANLGVSLEDVLTSLAVLTNEGVKADDASTQLLNVFLKLTKPTQTMKDFLQSLGFETGQAAIQALSFQGVLAKIGDAAKNDANLLAELGGELRAIRGLTGLTTRGQQNKFEQFKGQIAGPTVTTDFERAKQIRGESPGDQLIKEANKIKNFFTDDFGQNFISGLNKINKEYVSLSKIVEVTTKAVIVGVKTFAFYKVATIAVSGAAAILSINLRKQAIDTTAAALATEKLTFAQRAQSRLAGVAKLATGIFLASEVLDLGKSFSSTSQKGEEFATVLERITAARKGLNPEGESTTNAAFLKNQNAETAAFAANVDKVFQPLLANIAKSSIESRNRLAELRAQGVEAATTLSVAFQAATDKIKESLKTYAENIRDARKSIEQSRKDILGLTDTTDELILRLRQKFATPDQQFILRDNQLEGLKSRIQKLYAEGTDEAVAQAKQLGGELLRVTATDAEERVQRQVDIDREGQIRRAQLGIITPEAGNRPILAQTLSQEERIRQEAEFLANLEKGNIQKQQQKIANNEKLIEQDKERLRLLEAAQKDFLNLEPTNKAGDIKPEFKSGTGQFDQNKFLAEFIQKSQRVSELTKTDAEKAAVLVAIEAKRKIILEEQAELINKQKIDSEQLRLGGQKDQLKKDFEKSGGDRIKARTDLDTLGKQIQGSSDILKLFVDSALQDSSIQTIGNDRTGGLGLEKLAFKIAEGFRQVVQFDPAENPDRLGGGLTERGQIAQNSVILLDEIIKLNKQILADKEKLTARDDQGNLLGKQSDIQALNNDIGQAGLKLNQLVGRFLPDISVADRDNFAPPGGASVKEIIGTLRQQAKQAEEIFTREKNAQQAQENLKTSLESFVNKNVEALNPNTAAIIKSTETFAEFVKRLEGEVKPVKPADNIPAITPGFHDGGLLKGPRGFDNLLIRAEAGEFVMNQRATAKWLPQLIQMNRGSAPRRPGHYHDGGFVQTNVGDVNITMSGSLSPEKQVRELGRQLRRQIKRGNLDLTKKG